MVEEAKKSIKFEDYFPKLVNQLKNTNFDLKDLRQNSNNKKYADEFYMVTVKAKVDEASPEIQAHINSHWEKLR